MSKTLSNIFLILVGFCVAETYGDLKKTASIFFPPNTNWYSGRHQSSESLWEEMQMNWAVSCSLITSCLEVVEVKAFLIVLRSCLSQLCSYMCEDVNSGRGCAFSFFTWRILSHTVSCLLSGGRCCADESWLAVRGLVSGHGLLQTCGEGCSAGRKGSLRKPFLGWGLTSALWIVSHLDGHSFPACPE